MFFKNIFKRKGDLTPACFSIGKYRNCKVYHHPSNYIPDEILDECKEKNIEVGVNDNVPIGYVIFVRKDRLHYRKIMNLKLD